LIGPYYNPYGKILMIIYSNNVKNTNPLGEINNPETIEISVCVKTHIIGIYKPSPKNMVIRDRKYVFSTSLL